MIAAPAQAAEHDAQVWTTAAAKLRLDEDWALNLEAQGRFGDDVQRLNETQFKASVLRRVGPGLKIGAGYGHMIKNRAGGPDRHENRIWQELAWKPETGIKTSLSFRTRVEQRIIAGDTGWRVRSRLKATRPLGEGASLYAYGSEEAFFFLNDADWGARSGFDQSRIGAGLGWRFSQMASLEAGYLNRFKPAPDTEDKMNHIIALTVVLRP
ncbi:DUF2490 domain-containing protein [Hyphococcus luteus]|nr:DUF2490 domain-containing protein [Marinicaulis flavus]